MRRLLSLLSWMGTTILAVQLLAVERAKAYPSGAPSMACSSMTPVHPGSPQSQASSPYAVYVSAGQYTPGGQLTVTINGTQPFKGFLLIARTSSSSSVVGSFTASAVSQQVCGGGLTHQSNVALNSLSVQWTAPSSAQGPVNMYATVVQSTPIYWVALRSALVRDGASSASTTAASLQGGSVVTLTKSRAGCGTTASCFSSPSGCTGSDCNYLLAWRPMFGSLAAIDGRSTVLLFQLQGRTTSTPGYVSVGFGQSQSMIGLSIVNCVATSSGATVTQTYSSRYAEPEFLSVASTLQNVTAASSGNFIQCSFAWNNSARTSAQQYDLTASYYLVMARGPAVGNSAGNIMHHAEHPIFLNNRIAVASTLHADYSELTTFSTDGPNKATESRSTAGGTHGTEFRLNVIFSSSGSSLSRDFAMKWLLGLLSCVIALVV